MNVVLAMTASVIGMPPGDADAPRPVKARTRPAAALLEPAILRRAALQAFVKLDPRLMIKIPVMFVVEMGSVITTIEFFARPDLFVGLVTLWLWARRRPATSPTWRDLSSPSSPPPPSGWRWRSPWSAASRARLCCLGNRA
jgi:hypothetical protein